MRDWRRYERYSGSFMLEKCCHDLDLYNGVVGARPERVASFGGRKSFIPANDPAREGINDLELFHRKPSGWMGSDKVFDSDGDIIDYQVAIVEYANGVGMNFHTNLNVPGPFPPLLRSWAHSGMAEGDFVRNYFDVHDDADRQQADRQEICRDRTVRSTTAPTSRWRAISLGTCETARRCRSRCSMRWKPGILALTMDEARRKRSVVDLTAHLGSLRRSALRPERLEEGGEMSVQRSTIIFAWSCCCPAVLYVLSIVAYPLVDTFILSFTDAVAEEDDQLGRLGQLREDFQRRLCRGHHPHLRVDLLLGADQDDHRHLRRRAAQRRRSRPRAVSHPDHAALDRADGHRHLHVGLDV